MRCGLAAAVLLMTSEALAMPELYLPFPCGVTRRTTQGHNTGSHVDEGSWAWDFGLSVGDPVVAAAPGTVTKLKMDSTRYCDTSACANDANYVVVDHGDGTQALYLHMKANSAEVSVGQLVQRGQALAQVGLSGWLTGAHLHFQVEVLSSSWWSQSLHGSFVDAGDPTYPDMVTSGNCGTEPSNVVIVDDLSPSFSHNAGFFAETQSGGYSGHFFWTYSNGDAIESVGEWRATLPVDGLYAVAAYIPLHDNANTLSAQFEIHHVGGSSTVTQDQSVTGGFFGDLTTVKMASGEALRVVLRDNNGEPLSTRKIGFDAIRFSLVAEAGTAAEHDACGQHNDCAGAMACIGGFCNGPAATTSSSSAPASSAGGSSSSASPSSSDLSTSSAPASSSSEPPSSGEPPASSTSFGGSSAAAASSSGAMASSSSHGSTPPADGGAHSDPPDEGGCSSVAAAADSRPAAVWFVLLALTRVRRRR